MKCKNCGHGKEHHRTLGSLTYCAAVISRTPRILCDCKEFKKEAEKHD